MTVVDGYAAIGVARGGLGPTISKAVEKITRNFEVRTFPQTL